MSETIGKIKKIIYAAIIFLLISCFLDKDPFQAGEISSYLIPSVAFENNFSWWITEDDIEEAKIVFQELTPDVFSSDFLFQEISKPEEGLYRGYYAPTYSIALIPLRKLLGLFNMPQYLSVHYTNLLFLFISVLFFVNTIKERKMVAFCILFFNPILFYIRFISAEVFIYSVCLISITFFIQKKYKLAYLFAMIAATLNITIVFWGLVICISYFWDVCQTYSENNFFKKCFKFVKEHWKDILYYFILFVGCFYIFSPVPSERFNGFSMDFLGWIDRIRGYLFDMNIGIVFYYGLAFILFVCSFIKSVKEKNYNLIALNLGFWLILAAYSLNLHAYSGCIGISRYASWSCVFMIVAVLMAMKGCNNEKFFVYVIVATIYVNTITLAYGGMNNTRDYCKFNEISQIILNNVPHLYNDHPTSFAMRVVGDEMKAELGYNCEEIVYYTNPMGFVTKVLIPPGKFDELQEHIKIDDNRFRELKQKVNLEKYVYINFLPKEKVERK